MNLGTMNLKYEIEFRVINDELKPKKEGISMGETIEMINKHPEMQLWFRCGQHQMFTCRYAKFTSKSNVTSGG
jgi:acetolactate synthase-1/2/3 large subunit